MSHGPIQLVLRFRSTDFANWQAALKASDETRVRHGALGHQISRSIDDPNEFLAVVPFTSLGGAIGYREDAGRFGLEHTAFGRSAMRNHGWEESIHELIDAGGYGAAAAEFGRAWSPVSHRVHSEAAGEDQRL